MLTPTLQRFCFAHEAACLIPAETLGPAGLTPAMVQTLLPHLTPAQTHCLEQGFARYWQHTQALYRRAPQSWFAPRRLNVLLALQPQQVMPYLEPFPGTSVMLYASDLDTHPEYVAYLFAHTERLALTRNVAAALVSNLSWWFDQEAARIDAFTQAARRATRPDARVFVRLTQALPWVKHVLHNPLRVPAQTLTDAHVELTGTQLYVPQRLQGEVNTLCERAQRAMTQALQPYLAAQTTHAAPETESVAAICAWLRVQRPALALHTPEDGEVWTPADTDPEMNRLRRALAQGTDAGLRSLLADLNLVDARTRQFFAALRQPQQLPHHCGVLETGGGVYVDAARHLIVYELRQPNFDARVSTAPPYHRLLLGARVMHEWGHLAHGAQYLRIPEARRPQYQTARQMLGQAFLDLLRALPPALQPMVDDLLTSLLPQNAVADHTHYATALTRKTLARVGDYLANVMAARFIPGEEMQAYVRVNVRHHDDEGLDLVSLLARYAYEIHYLKLAQLERSYFYESSRFNDDFIESGLIQRAAAERLFDAVGQVLACYEVDEAQLKHSTL